MSERRNSGESTRRKREEWAGFRGADAYESRIGAFARATDREAILALLPLAGARRVLDLPSGAGRVSALLTDRRMRPLIADYSLSMLTVARERTGAPAVRCDAFAMPFRDASFGIALSLRLAFHYSELAPLAAAVHRVLEPGGHWIFDTLNSGSLRHAAEPLVDLLPRRRRRTGVYFAPPPSVAAVLAGAGFEVAASIARYLLPTRAYRFAPRAVHPALRRIEARVPPSRRVVTFWSARKAG